MIIKINMMVVMILMMMMMMLMTRGLVLMLRKVDDGFGAESNVRGIRTEDGGRFTSTRPVQYIEIHMCHA